MRAQEGRGQGKTQWGAQVFLPTPELARAAGAGARGPITFLGMLDDLANGLLQAVGSQHELFPRPEDLWPGRACWAHGAAHGRGTAATSPVPIFSLLGDGGGRVGQ